MSYASQINVYKHTNIRTSLKVGSNVRWLLLLPLDASLLLSPVACSGTTTIAITMNNTAARLVIILVGCDAEVELYFWRRRGHSLGPNAFPILANFQSWRISNPGPTILQMQFLGIGILNAIYKIVSSILIL